ncbi:MAG: TatD family hydrolase [Clostridia bacterium]|nr:TatD family hydrolase [Clostridia bacterium]MBQ2092735.1 TatD family hydrolase [Clostridia bacterium]
MFNIFDTHSHYDDEAFNEDREVLLGLLQKEGVSHVMTCGTNLVTSYRSLQLAQKYDYIYCALGFHPEEAHEERKGDLDTIKELLEKEPKAKAVGEIGLDYYWEENAPRDVQIDLFRRQIEIAKELDLPVIVHDREAHEDTFNILSEMRPKGVLHCYSGSKEQALQYTEMGFYIGLGGVVTFKNARKAVEVAEAIPLDKLLLETDCPYMAPVPHRGERNDSRLISLVAEKIGEIRGMDPQEIADITNKNAREFFGI